MPTSAGPAASSAWTGMFTPVQDCNRTSAAINGVYTNGNCLGRGPRVGHRRHVQHRDDERDPCGGGPVGQPVTLSAREWPGRHVYVEAVQRSSRRPVTTWAPPAWRSPWRSSRAARRIPGSTLAFGTLPPPNGCVWIGGNPGSCMMWDAYNHFMPPNTFACDSTTDGNTGATARLPTRSRRRATTPAASTSASPTARSTSSRTRSTSSPGGPRHPQRRRSPQFGLVLNRDRSQWNARGTRLDRSILQSYAFDHWRGGLTLAATAIHNPSKEICRAEDRVALSDRSAIVLVASRLAGCGEDENQAGRYEAPPRRPSSMRMKDADDQGPEGGATGQAVDTPKHREVLVPDRRLLRTRHATGPALRRHRRRLLVMASRGSPGCGRRLAGSRRPRLGQAQMDSAQFAPARDRLAWLSAWWPRQPKSRISSACARRTRATGRGPRRLGAVPAGSPLAALAALARGRALLDARGRFSEAETAYRAAMRGAGVRGHRGPLGPRRAAALGGPARRDPPAARRDLDESAPVDDRIAALREHWRLDSVIVAAEEVQPCLDQAARTAPDDDRVWLARAYLATRYGRYAEGAPWLDRSCGRSPDDPGRLACDVAMGAGRRRPEEAVACAGPDPGRRLTPRGAMVPPRLVRRRRDDAAAERDALEHLIAIEPGNTQALDRLARCSHPGRPGRSRRGAPPPPGGEPRDKERYRRLLIADRLAIPLDELHERARLAERLGRWFEAKGWLTLALERDPGDRLARDALDRLDRDEARLPANSVLRDCCSTRRRLRRPPGRDGARIQPSRCRKSSTIAFRDDADAAGLRFTYHNGESPQHQIPETIGGGVAVLDYDGDGWLDVYLVQGGTLPVFRHGRQSRRPRSVRAPAATACSATGATARSRTRRPPRDRRGSAAATASA